MVGYVVEMALAGRPVLLIGGGTVALRKLTGLLLAEPRIMVVAPALHPRVAERVRDGCCVHRPERFSPSLLDVSPPPALVFAVTGDAALNQEIARQCAQRGLLCNSADTPESSGFRVPAVVRRGPVTVAVATNGCSPALSRLLKERIEAWLEPGWGTLAALFGAMRTRVKRDLPDARSRHTFWRDTCLAVERERRHEKTDNSRWFEGRMSQTTSRVTTVPETVDPRKRACDGPT